MSEPLKVRISPKAMSTLWCISPNGGQQKPAMSNAQPKLHIATAVKSCKRFILMRDYLPLSTPSLTMLKTKACRVLNFDCALNATTSSST